MKPTFNLMRVSLGILPEFIIAFYPHRDPNSMKTLDVFDEAVRWLSTGNFTENDIKEAKLSVFQEV